MTEPLARHVGICAQYHAGGGSNGARYVSYI